VVQNLFSQEDESKGIPRRKNRKLKPGNFLLWMINRFIYILTWKRGYIWVTGAFFAVSLALQWTFALQTGDSSSDILATMFENWQSEFLQLMWQVAGLAILLYVGSPQSRV
jgi:hypothetical protein